MPRTKEKMPVFKPPVKISKGLQNIQVSYPDGRPRVLGPDEEVALPVSVFAMEPEVKDVAVSVINSGAFAANTSR